MHKQEVTVSNQQGWRDDQRLSVIEAMERRTPVTSTEVELARNADLVPQAG